MSTTPHTNDWLAAQTTAAPDALALITPDVRWTYRELNAAVDALCGRLATLSLPAGARLAMHTPNDAGAVALVHACARLGLVLVPINTRLAPAEVAAQLKLAQPAALICDSAAIASMTRLQASNSPPMNSIPTSGKLSPTPSRPDRCSLVPSTFEGSTISGN